MGRTSQHYELRLLVDIDSMYFNGYILFFKNSPLESQGRHAPFLSSITCTQVPGVVLLPESQCVLWAARNLEAYSLLSTLPSRAQYFTIESSLSGRPGVSEFPVSSGSWRHLDFRKLRGQLGLLSVCTYAPQLTGLPPINPCQLKLS